MPTLERSGSPGYGPMCIPLEGVVANDNIQTRQGNFKARDVEILGTAVQAQSGTITETTGAGTYTLPFTIPAGAYLMDIIVDAVALWDTATSATLKLGDADDDDGYFTGVNLKATDLLAGESLSFAAAGGKQGAYSIGSLTHWARRYFSTARTLTATVTTVGASGSAGRTRVTVLYYLPETDKIVAATKA